MNRRELLKHAGALSVAAAVAAEMRQARAMWPLLGGAASSASFIPIGVNYAAGGASALSYENLPMFKNRVREGRGFTQPNSYNSIQVALSSAGWPTQDFSLLPWEGASAPSWLTAATSGNPMKGYFIGSGSETITGTGCTIANVVHRSGGAYTTFDCYGMSGTFRIDITGTTGGATNIALYIAGYDLGGIDDVTQKSAYYPPALALYGALGGICGAWLSDTFYNTGQNTNLTRNTPSNTQAHKSWTGANGGQNFLNEGFPAEWLAYFCKYCGPQCDFYYTLPVWDDGTNGTAGSYTNDLLISIKNILLASGNNILLEIGREVWNSGSYPIGIGSGQTLNTLAVNSGIASSSTDFAGCWKYLGYSLHALANMCRTIFGSKFGTQIKIVLAAQSGSWGTQHAVALNYIDSTYGSGQAAQDIQYIAGACYSNLTNNAGDNSIAAVLSDLSAEAQVHPYADSYEHGSILAGMRGQRLIAYEGPSWQVNAEAGGNSYISAAIMDPGMEAVERDDITKPAFDAGCYKMFKFESGCSAGGGTYPPTDEWSNSYSGLVASGSPRYNAIIDLINTPYTPQRNVLSSRGQTFATSAWADNIQSGSAPAQEYNVLGTGYYGNCIQTYLPANMAGVYSLVYTPPQSASSCIIEVNGTQVYSGAISSSGTTVSGVTLKAGFNGILIYTPSGNVLTNAGSIQLN